MSGSRFDDERLLVERQPDGFDTEDATSQLILCSTGADGVGGACQAARFVPIGRRSRSFGIAGEQCDDLHVFAALAKIVHRRADRQHGVVEVW